MVRSLAVAALALLTSLGVARADTVTLTSNHDTTLYAENGALSNGSGIYMFTGVTDNSVERRALLSFDIAGALPPGATITSVTLTLRLTKTRTQNLTVALKAVTEAWGEGASDATGEEGAGAAAQTNDATWTQRLYPSTAWTTAGGSYSAVTSASTVVGNTLADYTWSSTTMVSDVQGWLDTPSSNHGWIIVAPAAGQKETKRFATRNNTDTTIRPRLTVVFTPPAQQTGACCAADGGCSVVLRPGSTCGGSYQGANTTCSSNTCPQPTGACCANDATAACTTTTQAACTGTFQGVGATCAMTTCPVVLTPFVDPLPIPRAAVPTSGTAGGAATYAFRIVQLQRKVHSALPPTTLWGFDDGAGASSPGPTIEARTGQPITVDWINDLRDGATLRTNHYLPVDSCITTDTTARTVLHLHGGHVPPESDGYPEATFVPGEHAAYSYPNNQPAATLWYHDHAMGITRLNVVMGLAGFYLVRDSTEQALALPSGADEIPLVIQDRTFDASGHVVYPAMWMPHYFGDTILVNGVVWPYLQVRQGKYRFRILNGSTSRTYTLALSDSATFHVIGTDGGLLPAPVATNLVTLMPGERADVIMDFGNYTAGTELVLTNSAPAPYPGTPGEGVVPNVMKFVVTSTAGNTAPRPASLVPVTPIDPASSSRTRDLVLKKRTDACTGEAWTINGLSWNDITERPTLGDTEIWRFINDSGEAHPMHLHLVQFQILDRQPFVMMNGVPVATDVASPPARAEAGWKDTVRVGPGEIVRVIARFTDYTGKYPYHCHMLEHEDRDMMRQFEVLMPPPGDACVFDDAGTLSDAGVPDAGTPANGSGGGGGCCDASGGVTQSAWLAMLVVVGVGRRRRYGAKRCTVSTRSCSTSTERS